ncbi:MAG TPA: hypothetical protein VFJ16_24085 [Longimicrobium sp.]|nr:hypothetical protein [Longimicrobium sp.]
MKKLALKLDDLHVETFATTRARRATGTVLGHVITVETCGGCVYSIDGAGAYCTYDPGCTGDPPTVRVTCDYGPTMNPLDTACVDATMAGATCDGAVNTCGRDTVCC